MEIKNVILKAQKTSEDHIEWVGIDKDKIILSAKYNESTKKLETVFSNIEQSITKIRPGMRVTIFKKYAQLEPCFSETIAFSHSTNLNYPSWIIPYIEAKKYKQALNQLNVKNNTWSDASRLVYLMTNCRYQFINDKIVSWLPLGINPLTWSNYFYNEQHAHFVIP